MDSMSIFGKGLLRFVSFEYVALGVVGLIGLFLPSSKLLTLCGWVMVFLLVAPLAACMEYGMQAICLGQPRGPWGCNLDAGAMQHARAMLMALCIASLVGGLLGIWGVSTRNNRVGHAVWFMLSVLSVAVALWNLKGFFVDSYTSNPLVVAPSILWAAAYATAYFRSARVPRPPDHLDSGLSEDLGGEDSLAE